MNARSRGRAATRYSQGRASNPRSQNNLCDNCGHFRSAHHYGKGACRDCRDTDTPNPCQEMVWEPPVRERRNRPPLTDEQLTRAKALLEDGASYIDAATTVGAGREQLRRLLPGYGMSLEDQRVSGRRPPGPTLPRKYHDQVTATKRENPYS